MFDGGQQIVLALRRCGFTDLTFFPDATLLQSDSLLQFDLIIGWSVGTNLTSAAALALLTAYTNGQKVLTISNFADASTVPLIATVVSRVGSVAWDINPITNVDNPFRNSFSSYNTGSTAGENIISTIRASALIAASTTYSGTKITAVYETNTTGGKWFHYQPVIDMAYTPNVNVGKFAGFFTSALNWLYSYAAIASWEIQIGEFMIDKIDSSSFPRDVKVTGRDYTKKIKNSKFDNATTFTAGTPLDTVIQALGANSGLTKFKLASNGAVLPTDYTFDRTSTRFDAGKGMSNACNVEFFVDAFGYLTTRPYLDPTLSPQTIALATGLLAGNLVEFTLSSDDSELFNRVVVSGESADSATGGTLYQAIAENHSPTSPTRIAVPGTPGGIDARTYFYTSTFFTANSQCQDYANRLLSYHALESFNIDFSSIVFPWLEAGEIIGTDISAFTDSIPNRYLLTRFGIPLGLGPMSGTSKRITVVG